MLRLETSKNESLISELGSQLNGPARVAVDAVGLVGTSVVYRPWTEDHETGSMGLSGFARQCIGPSIAAAASVLEDGAILGRVTCHIWIHALAQLVRVEEDGKRAEVQRPVPFEQEFTLPVQDGEVDRVSDMAARSWAREGGLPMFES